MTEPDFHLSFSCHCTLISVYAQVQHHLLLHIK